MKERPILFSAPMVRAILAGKKTQTRRVVKPKASESSMASFSAASGWYPDRYNHRREWCMWGVRGTTDHNKQGAWLGRCPYGDVGDRVWVRETWASVNGGAFYKADEPWPEAYGPEPKWKPSIHMPRWAARIILEVTDVRVERVQAITEEDALAEGVDRTNTSIPGYATQRFHKLWDSINDARGFGWATNPWVWALTFKRVQP